MTAHGIIAAGAQDLFHVRTWVAESGTQEPDLADGELAPQQRRQVDPADDQIAPQSRGVQRGFAEQCSDHSQAFGLHQGNTAGTVAAAIMVPFQSGTGQGADLQAHADRAAAAGAQADPSDPPVAGELPFE